MDNKPVYLSAEALGVEQWERDGLAALVGPLSRGEIKINMDDCFCHSVGCIGGWLAYRSRQDLLPREYVKILASPALEPLFFPGGAIFDWDGIRVGEESDHPGWRATAPQAAHAIVNFLTLGDPKWSDVMRESA